MARHQPSSSAWAFRSCRWSADSLADLYRELDLLGHLTGARTTTARLMEAMQRRVEQVAATARTIQPGQRVTVFYQVWSEPLMAAGPGSYIGELIAICGGDQHRQRCEPAVSAHQSRSFACSRPRSHPGPFLRSRTDDDRALCEPDRDGAISGLSGTTGFI